jgi:hypothetical protein
MGPIDKKIREEIKEYSHLLRALKTSSVADLSAHIYPSQSSKTLTLLAEGNDLDAEQKPSGHDASERAFWTKWPLLASEVYPAPWSFEEELTLLAEQALSADAPEDEDALVDSKHLSSPVTKALMETSLYALGQALSLISDNIPHVDKGVQFRVKAADWRLVLQLLSNSTVFPDE